MRFTCVIRVLSAHELGGRYYRWTRRPSPAPLVVIICPIGLSFVPGICDRAFDLLPSVIHSLA